MAVYEFPTSSGQRRMWLLSQMDPEQPTYNIAWALWLTGDLSVDALRGAWDEVIARHEALHTTFRDDSGVPAQVIDDDAALPALAVESLESAAAPEDEARVRIAELARAPMDLATGPLVQATLFRLAPQRHVLAVVMHHIVADGWSLRILFRELAADYQALHLGQSPSTVEPDIQYADFAIWQHEYAQDGGFAPAERFWREHLTGAPSALALPVDHPYASRQTFAARAIESTLDSSVATDVREAAARDGATLFAVLLAGYAVVLSRLTGADDVVIAVPVAARTRAETESVIGLFMNTMPIRLRVPAGATLAGLVRSVHEVTAHALAHQELPFARVVELLRPERDPVRLPLAQVMFALDESWTIPDAGGLRWRPELVDTGTAKFELELTVTDDPIEPRVRVNANSDLFDAATAQLVADGFDRVLRAIAARPDSLVGDVEIMPAGTLDLVTRRWPDGGPASPAAEPAAGTAFAKLWRACTGDGVVASGSDGTLTGAQVRMRAGQIAAALRERGIRPGDRVAILLPRGARLLPAILGVWAAGASYVPLDPIYPPQRLSLMLRDAGARAILVTGEPGLADPGCDLIDLASIVDDAPGVAGPVDVPPAAVAYTMFTSGSTGRPKAVTVTQGGLATLLDAVAPLFGLGPADRFVAISTFTFDIALVELVAPVLAGGTVIVADVEQVRDAVALRTLLEHSGATAMQATPAGWRMLVDAGGVPEGVRLRITAGEPLARDLADIIGIGPGIRLWNLYGPTETTIYSGGAAVEPSPAPIEIGSVIAGTRLYLLDDGLRPVPPGVLGEVYIGGAGLAHGYHAAPAQTAERFVPDPFSEHPGARLYRTGDVGRWRHSGRIELAGRADRQFKIRGYRVESGEIEATLRAQPDIADAVVSLRGAADARLVGYLVTRSGAQIAPADLRDALRRVLPDYMVPATFVVLPQLPLTPSGKVDHQALPEPEWTGGGVPTAPRTPVEAELAELFADVLSLRAPAGVTDNFFALGGHSLTATRLMARVRGMYGIDLPVRALFADPTVAGLAVAVEAARNGTGTAGPLGLGLSDAEAEELLRSLVPGESR